MRVARRAPAVRGALWGAQARGVQAWETLDARPTTGRPAPTHRPAAQGHTGGVRLSRHAWLPHTGWGNTPLLTAPAATQRRETPEGHAPSACAPGCTPAGPHDARVPTASRRRRPTLQR